MHKTFTFYQNHIFSVNLQGTNRKKPVICKESNKNFCSQNLLPSAWSLSLIMGYASALQVMKTATGEKINLIIN
jgi:hypothetical protein